MTAAMTGTEERDLKPDSISETFNKDNKSNQKSTIIIENKKQKITKQENIKMKNNVLENFKNGKVSIGTFNHMQSTNSVLCLGATGLDFLIVDTEHNAADSESAQHYITTARGCGISPLVRIDGIVRSAVLKALDEGAHGIIVPGVKSVDDAKKIVEFAKFAPVGDRGFCPTHDGVWGAGESMDGVSIDDYMKNCNEETMVILQCETRGCLEHIDEITAMEGVDGIMIGPFDMSIALGKPAQFDDPEVKAAFAAALAACKKYKKLSMMFCGGVEAAKGYIEQGFDSVIVGLDNSIYIDAYKNIVSELR